MRIAGPGKAITGAALIRGAVFFFAALAVLVLFLYGIGTRQVFMDTTQLFLLRLAMVIGILLAASAVYGVFLQLWLVFHRKQYRFFGGLCVYLALALAGIGLALLGGFITVIAGGNIP
jgi:hypothetical protein